MRIGLVSDTYAPQVNGVTTVVRRIVALLSAQGHAVAIVAPRYPGTGEDPPNESELRVASLAFPLYPAIRLSLPRFRDVAKFFDAFQPDLVHVHTEGSLGMTGRRYALRRSLPLVTSYHTNFAQYSRHYGFGFLAPAVWRWLERFHAPARLTLTPGEEIRDDLVRRGIRAVAWGRGVDTHLFYPGRRQPEWRRWLAGGDDTTIVLHVGRLAAEKNLDVLIAAWRRARETLGQRATFVVAGEGPLERRVASRLPFVRMLGFLPRQDLAALYASADLCVFPSHSETCGLVALEAMSSGVAVIAANASGFRESVQDGVTGLLVPPLDPQAYVEAMSALVLDPARRLALAAAAREWVLPRDVARENAELLRRYAELIQPAPRRAATCAA